MLNQQELGRIMQNFGEEMVHATVNNIIGAMHHLSNVEFRMWLDHCKQYENIHYSHFHGLEKQFIETGKWEFRDGDPAKGDSDGVGKGDTDAGPKTG